MPDSIAMPTEEQLRSDYVEWFKDQYQISPVITSSTGMPAVHFAQYILKRYAPLLQCDDGED